MNIYRTHEALPLILMEINRIFAQAQQKPSLHLRPEPFTLNAPLINFISSILSFLNKKDSELNKKQLAAPHVYCEILFKPFFLLRNLWG